MSAAFAMQFAETLPDPNRSEKALPPVTYPRDRQYFAYRFDGVQYTAAEVFSDNAPAPLREHLKSMSITQGSTGKRDYCFI